MEDLSALLRTLRPLFDAVGILSTLIVIVSAGYAVYLWISGLLPVLVRLGNGLRRRKIAIFAKGDAVRNLGALLEDSQLFKSTNVLPISSRDSFGRAEEASMFLVYWPDWDAEEMGLIIQRKEDATALIVYAPQAAGRVPDEMTRALERERNVVLCNFRGRLLNDIIVSMITTGYEKR